MAPSVSLLGTGGGERFKRGGGFLGRLAHPNIAAVIDASVATFVNAIADSKRRKDSLSLYLCGGLESSRELLGRLGKHKLGGGCLYVRSLEDVHLPTFGALLEKAARTPPAGAASD